MRWRKDVGVGKKIGMKDRSASTERRQSGVRGTCEMRHDKTVDRFHILFPLIVMGKVSQYACNM